MLQIQLSLQTHQALLNAIIEHSDQYGFCNLSQSELGKIIGKSPSWVSNAIKQLNQEKPCIQKTKDGYRALTNNIIEQGCYFDEILNLIKLFHKHPEFETIDENILATKLEIKRTTIQGAKAFNHELKKGSH